MKQFLRQYLFFIIIASAAISVLSSYYIFSRYYYPCCAYLITGFCGMLGGSLLNLLIAAYYLIINLWEWNHAPDIYIYMSVLILLDACAIYHLVKLSHIYYHQHFLSTLGYIELFIASFYWCFSGSATADLLFYYSGL